MQLIYRDNFCHLAHSSNFGRKRITPLGETVIIYFTSWRGCDLYQLKILHRFDINMNIPRTIGHVNIYNYTYTSSTVLCCCLTQLSLSNLHGSVQLCLKTDGSLHVHNPLAVIQVLGLDLRFSTLKALA